MKQIEIPQAKVIPLQVKMDGLIGGQKSLIRKSVVDIETPITDQIISSAEKLSQLSKYKMDFDFETYRKLELRFSEKRPRGGITFKSPFRLVNSHQSCQQCLYSFEVDTYGRGCVHNCTYCYAKAELTVHGYWNNPIPMPADITQLWKTFYTVFETDKKSKWRNIMEKRIPIRIGSMSDSFMWIDKKHKVTQEFIKILNFYKYPYLIFTRSDLIAEDEYLSLLDHNLASIQFSISSTNEELNKLIEPGAPSAKRRLLALQKLVQAGFWTTVRINPFFPIFPDGYFTDPNFDKNNMPEPFNYSSFEMIDEIGDYGVQSILAGMVRLSSFSLRQMEKAVGRDLECFYKDDTRKDSLQSERTKRKSRDYHYSDEEIRAYYKIIANRCMKNKIQFTTCYIGNGENQFWRDQDLWSNKVDCCNVKNRVSGFKSDSREIPWEERLKHTSHQGLQPNEALGLSRKLGTVISARSRENESNI